ncbi:ATP-binding protein [Actinacidiphila guanduensis]|nr:ATP-binding protein [Actinacidiphila guanduensis]
MDEYTSRHRMWELTCAGSPEEVGRARRWTRTVLRGSPHAENAEVIVSELASNAVLHSDSGRPAGTFRLRLAVTFDAVEISVTDAGGSPSAPRLAWPDEEDTHHRGLLVVNALAQHVEIRGDRAGRTVTARLFHDRGRAVLPAEDGQRTTPGRDPRPLSGPGGRRQSEAASAVRSCSASRTALLRVSAGAA